MKQHFALVDTNGIIHDTLEVNEGEVKFTPPLGLEWVEIKSINKDFHKDPEKYNVIKKESENTSKRKDDIILTASSDKAYVGDTISITIDIPGDNKTTNLNINGQTIQVVDGEVIDIDLVSEGTYKIVCEDKDFYCPIVWINVLERV